MVSSWEPGAGEAQVPSGPPLATWWPTSILNIYLSLHGVWWVGCLSRRKKKDLRLSRCKWQPPPLQHTSPRTTGSHPSFSLSPSPVLALMQHKQIERSTFWSSFFCLFNSEAASRLAKESPVLKWSAIIIVAAVLRDPSDGVCPFPSFIPVNYYMDRLDYRQGKDMPIWAGQSCVTISAAQEFTKVNIQISFADTWLS